MVMFSAVETSLDQYLPPELAVWYPDVFLKGPHGGSSFVVSHFFLLGQC